MTELEWARSIVGQRQNPTVIELGAHHGHDTVRIFDACRGGRTRYVAVEADPRNVPILRRAVRGRKVQVVHAAIADHCGTAMLHLSGGPGQASSSIREPREHLKHFPDIPFDGRAAVPAITLDALAARRRVEAVDLIWCDIQGAERDMIAGGQETLARTRYLMAEADRCEMYGGQATRDDLIALLPGWELVAEWPANANLLLKRIG